MDREPVGLRTDRHETAGAALQAGGHWFEPSTAHRVAIVRASARTSEGGSGGNGSFPQLEPRRVNPLVAAIKRGGTMGGRRLD
jgi:hypothetical protein